jgi:hypothetical protein
MHNHHLDFFLSIESDLEMCSRYVEFSSANFPTYSTEFSRIIMAASAEIDTLCKELCRLIDPTRSVKNIREYGECIRGEYPEIDRIEVELPRYGIKLKPWDKWFVNGSPSWWTSYNKIKHDRYNCFDQATLHHGLSAVSALLIIMLYFYHKKDGKELQINAFHAPKLFSMVEEDTGWKSGGVLWGYTLKV